MKARRIGFLCGSPTTETKGIPPAGRRWWVVIALCVCASASWADPIIQAKHWSHLRDTFQRRPDQFQLPLEQVGTDFSLHAGAQAGKVGPNTTHYPQNQPMGVSGVMPTRIITPVVGPFSSKRAEPTRNLPANVMPATAKKDFTGRQFMTGLASADDERVSSQAEAVLRVTKDNKSAFFDTRGTFARVIPRRGRTTTDKDAAGAQVLDPLLYGDVPKDAVFSSVLSFFKDDFEFQVDDEQGVAGSVIELGANLPDISPGPLGSSYAGNTLLYRLTFSFNPDFDEPFVNFTSNRDGIGFFMPGTNILLTDDDIEQRLIDSVMRQPNSNIWSLKDDIDLFELTVALRADVRGFQVDQAHGVIAAITPEPHPLTLGGIGIACLGFYRWRRGRRLSCAG